MPNYKHVDIICWLSFIARTRLERLQSLSANISLKLIYLQQPLCDLIIPFNNKVDVYHGPPLMISGM